MSFHRSLFAGAVAFAGLSAAAFAVEPTPAVEAASNVAYDPANSSVAVQTSDLNLRSRQGANIAVQRIVDMSNRACGLRPTVDPLYQESLRDFRICRDQTARNAVEQTGSNLVARIYGQLYGGVIVE